MVHCEGGSLRDSLRTKRYSVPEAIALAVKIAEALAFVHGRNVVHHDIKPENILFDADGRRQPRGKMCLQASVSGFMRAGETERSKSNIIILS